MTLAELSKPAYQPLVFKPVTPTKRKPGDLQLGQKRMAPDGTEISIYNQSLYENSVASSNLPSQRPQKKVQRFQKTRREIRQAKLDSSLTSGKSNMLEPMSDVSSMRGLDEVNEQAAIKDHSRVRLLDYGELSDHDEDGPVVDDEAAAMEFDEKKSGRSDAHMD